MIESDLKVITPRVSDYGPKPRGPKQALIQAHAFLTEEGQWMTGTFFQDGDPKEAYEKGRCSSWSACAMGALGLVTGEAPVVVCKVTYDWDTTEQFSFETVDDYNPYDTPISYKAARALSKVIDPERFKANEEDEYHDGMVISLNDTQAETLTGRTKVLDVFVEAIRSLGGEPLVDHRAEAKRAQRNAKRRAARAQAKKAVRS